MRLERTPLLVAILAVALCGMVTTTLPAQVKGSDPNIIMMDNCSESDPDYNPFGGCPEGAPFPGWRSYPRQRDRRRVLRALGQSTCAG